MEITNNEKIFCLERCKLQRKERWMERNYRHRILCFEKSGAASQIYLWKNEDDPMDDGMLYEATEENYKEWDRERKRK